MRFRNLHLFACFTATCTFFLIIAGGLVTSTGSGLSVPDWPNTYGYFMFAYPLDQMVGGIFYEHSHRMIASFVGFLTVILAIWLWRSESRRWVRNLGWIALASVIIQGILGGLTVRFMLPTPISVSHATLAQSFFCLIASLALFTSKWWRTDQPIVRERSGRVAFPLLAFLATAAVMVQLILGAIMRHMGAGLAIPDFPLSYGSQIPSLSHEAIATYNQILLDSGIRIAADDPVVANQILVHFLHRAWAIVVSVIVIWVAIRCIRFSAVSKRVASLGIILLSLLIFQITLGIVSVIDRKPVDITTAHVATGALLLVTSCLTSLHVARLHGVRLNVAASPIGQEVPA